MVMSVLVFEVVSDGEVCLVFEVVSDGDGLLCLRKSVIVGFMLVFEVVSYGDMLVFSDGGVYAGV